MFVIYSAAAAVHCGAASEPPPDIIVNIWRRVPSGRIDTQSMRRKQTGDATTALANLFFEA